MSEMEPTEPPSADEELEKRRRAMMYWHERALAAEEDFARTLRERDALRTENERLRTIVPGMVERLNDELCDENEKLREALQRYMAAVRYADSKGALMAAIKDADDNARALLGGEGVQPAVEIPGADA